MQGILPDAFNIQTAAEMMEKDTLSQSINLALRGHQHFDWLELATNGATAGFMGGIPGQKINQTLNKIDQNTGILSSELQSLATSGTNNHFDAAQILTDNLGNALGSGLIRSNINTDPAAWNNDAYDSLTYHSELLKDWDNGEVNPQFENNALLGSLYGSKSFIFDPNVSVDAMGLGLVNSVSNFYLLQNHIFEHEGSMSHHPNDAGGYTNKGITFATFEQYAQIDVGVKPTLDNLKKLTNEQASVIYKKRFWDPIKADDINSLSLAYSLYDFHVNAPGQAVKLMQKSVNFLGGELVIDNKMGSKTIKAINGVDAHKLFDVYQQKKIDYYTQRVIMIPTQRVFLNGWLNRINNIKFEK